MGSYLRQTGGERLSIQNTSMTSTLIITNNPQESSLRKMVCSHRYISYFIFHPQQQYFAGENDLRGGFRVYIIGLLRLRGSILPSGGRLSSGRGIVVWKEGIGFAQTESFSLWERRKVYSSIRTVFNDELIGLIRLALCLELTKRGLVRLNDAVGTKKNTFFFILHSLHHELTTCYAPGKQP